MIGITNSMQSQPINNPGQGVVLIKFAKEMMPNVFEIIAIGEKPNVAPDMIINDRKLLKSDIPVFTRISEYNNESRCLLDGDNTSGVLEYLYIYGNLRSLEFNSYNLGDLKISSIYINNPTLKTLKGVDGTSANLKSFEMYDNNVSTIGEFLQGANLDRFILNAISITDISPSALLDCTVADLNIFNLRTSLDISNTHTNDESIKTTIYSVMPPINADQTLKFLSSNIFLDENRVINVNILDKGWKLLSNVSIINIGFTYHLGLIRDESDGRLFNFIPSNTPPTAGTYTENIAVYGLTPILIWLDGINIKYYSTAVIYLPVVASNIFSGVDYIEKMDLSKIKTSHTEYVDSLFMDCIVLSELILTEWDTSNVETMNEMFSGCEALTTVSFGSSFLNTSLQSAQNMFNNCTLQASAYPQWTNGTWDYTTGTFTKS